jgi:hypothetical protein
VWLCNQQQHGKSLALVIVWAELLEHLLLPPAASQQANSCGRVRWRQHGRWCWRGLAQAAASQLHHQLTAASQALCQLQQPTTGCQQQLQQLKRTCFVAAMAEAAHASRPKMIMIDVLMVAGLQRRAAGREWQLMVAPFFQRRCLLREPSGCLESVLMDYAGS